jgi:hypothetical protein
VGLLAGWVLSGWLLTGCQGEPSNLGVDAAEVEVPAAAAPELAPGVVIDLGTEDGPAHLTEGFSAPERIGSRRASWSEGETSSVAFSVRGDAPEYLLAFLAEPYHVLGDVSMGVSLNRRSVVDTIVTRGWRAYSLVVSGNLLAQGRNELLFHYTKTGRPSDFDPRSNDVRELSVRFDQIQVQPITSEAQLSFGSRNAVALAALGDGWARDPNDRGTGTWTVANRAVVTVHIARSAAPMYRVSLAARTPRGVAEQPVAISLNGETLGQLAFHEKKSTLSLDVPAQRLKGENEIALDFAQLKSPAELDPSSKDTRLLGLRVFELDVSPK